jgi:hypothetical protein
MGDRVVKTGGEVVGEALFSRPWFRVLRACLAGLQAVSLLCYSGAMA